MPEMDGPTLLKELRRRDPKVKIIFVSGYAEEAFQKNLPSRSSTNSSPSRSRSSSWSPKSKRRWRSDRARIRRSRPAQAASSGAGAARFVGGRWRAAGFGPPPAKLAFEFHADLGRLAPHHAAETARRAVARQQQDETIRYRRAVVDFDARAGLRNVGHDAIEPLLAASAPPRRCSARAGGAIRRFSLLMQPRCRPAGPAHRIHSPSVNVRLNATPNSIGWRLPIHKARIARPHLPRRPCVRALTLRRFPSMSPPATWFSASSC